MSGIFEALEQTGKKPVAQPARLRQSSDARLIKTLTGLYQNILTLLPDQLSRTILFVGAREQQGTSVLSREFAKFIASTLNKKVLLVDADSKNSSQIRSLNCTPKMSWLQAAQADTAVAETLCRIAETSLHVAQLSRNSDSSRLLLELPRLDAFFNELKQTFEIILIDSPAWSLQAENLLISSRIDGVALVVEAEKTRWQVAERAKEKIISQGGKILGVVLNRRRYPIPGFIYDRI